MILQLIISFIFSIVRSMITVILLPISILITQFVPSLNIAFESIVGFLGIISDGLGYAVSWTLLSPTAFSLIVSYFTFILIFPLAVYPIKLTIAWYHKLKP